MKKCKFCLKTYDQKNKDFCSIACFKKYRKSNSKNKVKRRGLVYSIECVFCGIGFVPRTKLQKYCSRSCFEKNESLKKSNLDSSYYKNRFFIFNRDGFKCVYCGRNPKEDNVKLQIEHILAKKNGGTNSLDNYVTSCQDCNLGKGTNYLTNTGEEYVRKVTR